MSSKGKSVIESKGKGSNQSGKNSRRRSRRHASLSNGDQDDSKERAGKRGREANKESNDYGYDEELYKSVIDLVPSTDFNCSPTENPAIPGTQVNLHGVILHETQGGLIVLNVRWRNQVYSGALIDIEKTKWAAERIPTEGNSELTKFSIPVYNNAQPPIKKLRIPTSTLNQHLADDSDSGSSTSVKKKSSASPTTPSKSTTKSRANGGGKKRNSGPQDPTSPTTEETQNTPKKTKLKILTNGVNNGGYSSTIFECPEPNCDKKYKNKNGLTNHQKHQHTKKIETFEEKDTKSDESDSGDDNFVIDEKAGEDSSKEEEEITETPPQQNIQPTTKPPLLQILPKTETVESKAKIKLEDEESVKEKKMAADIKVEVKCQVSQLKEEKKPVVEQPSKMSAEPVVSPDKPVPVLEIQMDKQDHTDQPVTTSTTPQTSIQSSVPTIHVVRSSPSAPPLIVNSGESKPLPPPSIVVVKSEEERQRSGSSQIIIHSDHENSLNELFPPAKIFHQYSPTLSSLNPQKLNQSITEALTKQQAPTNTINAVVSSAPLIIARMESTSTPASSTQITKPVISNKPSIEIKPSNFDLLNSQGLFYNPPMAQSVDGLPKTEDIIDGSEDERSVSPENILSAVHHVFPQKELSAADAIETIKVTKPNNIMTSLALTAGAMLGGGGIRSHAQNTFENNLIFRDFASQISNEAFNLSPHLFSGKMGPVPSLMVDSKISPQLLRSMSGDQKSSSLGALIPGMVAGDDLKSLSGVEQEKAKPSLLHQRLTAGNTTPANKHFPSSMNKLSNSTTVYSTTGRPAIAQKLESTVPGTMPQDFRFQADKMIDKIAVTTSLTLNTSRVPEKPKGNLNVPTGLRINPPPEERQLLPPPSQSPAKSWQQYPDNLKDSALALPPSAQQQYRGNPALSKSISMNDLPVFATPTMETLADNRQKMQLKRTTSTIPIAPAPSMTASSRLDPTVAPGNMDYTVPETAGGNREIFQHRFTLTSDKRLVSSPSENRGRPKKIRVGQTAGIPIGTVQEVSRSRGAPDSSIPRSRGTADNPATRKVTSPVVRPSVIQGSIHPTPSLSDHTLQQKKPEHHMFQLPRSVNELGSPALVDERVRFSQQVKMSSEARNSLPASMADKYREKNLKTPPGMYFNQQNQRRILSPPSSRSPAISPRGPVDGLPRSPPSVFPHDMVPPPGSKPYMPFGGDGRDKYPFPVTGAQVEAHARMTEHLRKQELHRSASETGRPGGPGDSRKSVLSPLEGGLGIPPSFGRPHHDYEKEYNVAFSRHQSPRGEITPRDITARSSIYDHRVGHDENEQSRIRDRYLMAPGLASQQTIYTLRNPSSPPPVHSNAPSTHSSNLALGRADGSILTKLPSNYEAPKR